MHQVELHRLWVGHTHEMIDQLFGVISRFLRGIMGKTGKGRDVLTPQQLVEALYEAISQGARNDREPARVVLSEGAFDFESFITGYINPHLKGYAATYDPQEAAPGVSRIPDKKCSNTHSVRISRSPEGFVGCQFKADAITGDWGEFHRIWIAEGPKAEDLLKLQFKRYSANDWDKLDAFKADLDRVARHLDSKMTPGDMVPTIIGPIRPLTAASKRNASGI